VDSYTKLALDWLADHPNPETVTADPNRWAEQTSQSIRQRIHEVVDQFAPSIPAIDEHLPIYEPSPDREDWTPLVPDISDLL
jgi:hypothetical protein